MVPVPDDDEGATIEVSGKVLEKLGGQQGDRRHRGEGRRGEGADPRPRHRPPPVNASRGTRPALADYTTLGLGGPARTFVSAGDRSGPDRRGTVGRRGRRAGAAHRRRLQPGHLRRGLPRHGHPREHPRPRLRRRRRRRRGRDRGGRRGLGRRGGRHGRRGPRGPRVRCPAFPAARARPRSRTSAPTAARWPRSSPRCGCTTGGTIRIRSSRTRSAFAYRDAACSRRPGAAGATWCST